jgi:hypothetical protein
MTNIIFFSQSVFNVQRQDLQNFLQKILKMFGNLKVLKCQVYYEFIQFLKFQ